MSGYTKLFSSILMSSIWEESTETRLVWVTLLALSDQHGHVDGTPRSLARVARISLIDCKKALSCLLGEDDDDRSGVLDGRRIVPSEGGWDIVNHGRYRAKMSTDERRERDRIRKRQSRMSARSPQTSENVRDFQHTEAEADTKAKAEEQARAAALRVTPQSSRVTGGVILSPADYERLQRHNAYVGARLRVPHKLHGDFVALLGGESPDAVLRAFYASVDAELEQTGEPIAPDVWKWLTARFQRFLAERLDAIESAKFLAGS